MIKDYFVDKEEKVIRGGMINAIITMSILSVTCYGLLFSDVVVTRIKDIGFFIVSFFTASYGIYQFKQHMGDRLNSAENIANIQQGNIIPPQPNPPQPGQPIPPATYQPPPSQPVNPQPAQPVSQPPVIAQPVSVETQPATPTVGTVVEVTVNPDNQGK